MQKNYFLPALVLLVCLSCAKESYPPIVYTNLSNRDITFRTTEKDSPLYKLNKLDPNLPGSKLTLDSDERGRSEIISVYPPYIGWEWKNGDIYAIEFQNDPTKLPPINLHIKNTTTEAVTLTEKHGYLYQGETDDPEKVEVPAAGEKTVKIYTQTPVFELSGNTYPASVSYQYNAADSTMNVFVTAGN